MVQVEVGGRGKETPPLSILATSVSAVFFGNGRVALIELINPSPITNEYGIVRSYLLLLNEC